MIYMKESLLLLSFFFSSILSVCIDGVTPPPEEGPGGIDLNTCTLTEILDQYDANPLIANAVGNFGGAGNTGNSWNGHLTLNTPLLLGDHWQFSVYFKPPLIDSGEGYNTMLRAPVEAPGGLAPVLAQIQPTQAELGVWNAGWFGCGFDMWSLNEGQWYELKAIGTNGTTTFFIDGTEVGVSNSQATLTVLYIGKNWVDQEWNTEFDDVRFWTECAAPLPGGLPPQGEPNCFSGLCYGEEGDEKKCACASGYRGSSCANAVAANCSAFWGTLDNLETNNYPTLVEEETSFANDNLNILVTTPLVTDRRRTIVYLNQYNYTDCAFPAGNNWVKTFDEINCQENYRASIPWEQGVNCGWIEDSVSEPGFTTYRGYVYMEHYDFLDVFRGDEITRDTIHVMPIKIRFKTQVEVSTAIKVFAPVNLLAAITLQTYDPINNEGDLEFRTSLQWPFELVNVALPDYPENMTASISEVPFDCPTGEGEPACDQLWHIDITPITACTLSGIYNLTFTVACRGDAADCPLIDGSPDNEIEIIGTVVSEDFCTEVALDIGLTGTMDSYEDGAYSIPRSAFLYNQTAHFGIVLSTDGAATIQTSTINEVRVYDEIADTSNFLLSSGSITAEGTASSFTIDPSPPSADQPGFNFVINDDSTPVEVDQNVDYTVFAIVDVTYTGGVGSRYNFNFAKRQFDDSEERNGGGSVATANIGTANPPPTALPETTVQQTEVEETDQDQEVQDDENSASSLFLSMFTLFIALF